MTPPDGDGSGEDRVAALARLASGDTLDVDGLPLQPEVLCLVPLDLAFEHGVLGIQRSNGVLTVAVPAGSFSDAGLLDLERRLGLRIEAIPVSEIDVRGVLVKAHQLLLRREAAAPSPSTPSAAPPRGQGLAELGLPAAIVPRLRAVLSEPQGMLLVTGPARSGKSTTLRAIAAELAAKNQSVAWIDARQGVAALEEALAKDPDAVVVDETSSPAIASRALRAVPEGRRVILALRAPDAAAALAQLAGMNVDPHLVATAARAALNQRLLDRVCDGCAESRPEEAGVLEDLRLEKLLRGVPLRRGKGCASCGKTGRRGAVAVYEYGGQSPGGRLREGFQPLIADALAKLVSGQVPLQEVADRIPFTQLLQAADRLNVKKVGP